MYWMFSYILIERRIDWNKNLKMKMNIEWKLTRYRLYTIQRHTEFPVFHIVHCTSSLSRFKRLTPSDIHKITTNSFNTENWSIWCWKTKINSISQTSYIWSMYFIYMLFHIRIQQTGCHQWATLASTVWSPWIGIKILTHLIELMHTNECNTKIYLMYSFKNCTV